MFKVGKVFKVKKSKENILNGFDYESAVILVKKHELENRWYVGYFRCGVIINNGVVHERNLIEVD